MSTYEFGSDFQDSIAALIIKDSSIITSVRSVVKPEYFSDPTVRKIVALTLEFISKYKTAPGRTELTEFISSKTDRDTVYRLRKLYKLRIKNPKFIRESMVDFAQFTEMKKAIVASADELGSYDNHIKLVKRMTNVLKIGLDTRDSGIHLLRDRADRILQRERHGLFEYRLTTGIKKLDRFMQGGSDIGEEYVILAPPKGFKTGTLLNIGAAAVNARKKVSHITLEVSEENMALRYDRRFSGLTKSEIISGASKLDGCLRRIESFGGGLIIKGYPMRSVTVDHLHNYFEFMRSEGFVPDLVIVDYGDLLKPTTTGEYRHQLGQIYAEMRALSQVHKTRLWTASQANRKSVEKKTIRREDIAESFDKVAIADGVIAVCQTKEERKVTPLPRARLFMAANREGEEGSSAHISIDYDRMRIRELNDDFEEEDDE